MLICVVCFLYIIIYLVPRDLMWVDWIGVFQSYDIYSLPIPDPHPKTCINFYQHILFPGKFAVIVQQSHIRKLRFKY